MSTHLLLRQLLFLFAVSVTTSVFSQSIVVVTECNLNGWIKEQPPSTTVRFVDGPPAAPLGKGSLQFNALLPVTVRVRNINYSRTLLSDLTELKYSTYVQQAESNLDVPFIVLQIDNDGNGTVDNPIVFNPRWQTGNFIIGSQLPDQGNVAKNIWQIWDALNGGWWTGPAPNPDNGGLLYKLSTYISLHPAARIMNNATEGGIRINGSAGIFLNNFIGNVDAFVIGINNLITTYDFENNIADAGPDKTVIYGYGPNCTTLTGTAAGGVAPYSYSWSGGGTSSNSQNIEVCPVTTTTYQLTVTDVNGCTRSDEVTLIVNDVRCADNMHKVLVCHNTLELCVSPDAVRAHLNHGDFLGGCPFSTSKAIVEKQSETISPGQLKLSNYPNPFSTTTTIQYPVPFDCYVSMKVYDVSGRLISTLVSENKKTGFYHISFDSKNLSTGVYYAQMTGWSGTKFFTTTIGMIKID